MRLRKWRGGRNWGLRPKKLQLNDYESVHAPIAVFTAMSPYLHVKGYSGTQIWLIRALMGDAFSVSAGVVDLVTEVPRPENRLI